MFFDTDFNSLQTVLKNIFHSFMETAMKFHRTVQALIGSRKPTQSLLIKVTSDLLELAFLMVRNSCGESRCQITRTQVRWSVYSYPYLIFHILAKSLGILETDSAWYLGWGQKRSRKPWPKSKRNIVNY